MKRWLYLSLALPAFAAAAEPRNPLDALRLESLTATRERPLFTPSRRPPPPPAQVEAAPPVAPVEVKVEPPAPPPFELIGSVVGEGESFALLRNRATAKVVRLRPGDEAEGWRVSAIGVRSISLERDGREEALALAVPSASAEAAPAPELAGDPTEPVAPSAADPQPPAHRARNR